MKEKVKLTSDEENSLVNPILHLTFMHVVSPFERAIADHKFQPFQYQTANRSIYISNTLLHELRQPFFKKLKLLFQQIEKEKYCVDIPIELREVFDDHEELNYLPKELKSKLSELGCCNLYSIMIKRRRHFEFEHKFSFSEMEILDTLFAKHNCKKLFDLHYHPGS